MDLTRRQALGGLFLPLLGVTTAKATDFVERGIERVPLIASVPLQEPRIPVGAVVYGGRVILETSAGPLALPFRPFSDGMGLQLRKGDKLDLKWFIEARG